VALDYCGLKPTDLDDLTGIQMRQLADHIDRRIAAERRAEQEAKRG
jgi:hypothetical protein